LELKRYGKVVIRVGPLYRNVRSKPAVGWLLSSKHLVIDQGLAAPRCAFPASLSHNQFADVTSAPRLIHYHPVTRSNYVCVMLGCAKTAFGAKRAVVTCFPREQRCTMKRWQG
jgi:hypothetical protein